MDILINVANTLYVVAYFTTNMLRLRVLTLVAAACLALYFSTRPEPLWNVVAWNIFFLALNLWQVFRMLIANPRQSGESLLSRHSLQTDFQQSEELTQNLEGRGDHAPDPCATGRAEKSGSLRARMVSPRHCDL